MSSALPHARVGFVVPKYGHSSVDRNRLKRRLRELVRTRLLPALRPGANASGSAGSTDDTTARATAGAKDDAGADAGTAGSAIPSVDVVVRALPTAYDAPFSALAREVGRVYEGVRGRMMPSGS
jgi:RNase P protein component